MPLEPPSYVEILAIEDRLAARSSESGRRALACQAAGGGLLAWAVLVDDLAAVSARLGLEIFDYTIPHGDGTLRGWRAVSGPAHLPFFIDYPANGDRLGRWQAMYDRVGHTCAPTGFTELTISGSETEMAEWLWTERSSFAVHPREPGALPGEVRNCARRSSALLIPPLGAVAWASVPE